VSSLRIIDVGNGGDRWDAFVESSAHATFCHRYGWRAVMRDALGHQCLYLAAVDDSETWRAVLPLVRVKSVLGHYLISLPFLNEGGPLGARDAQLVLVQHAIAEARRSGAKLLELRSRVELPGDVTPSYRKITVKLALPASSEALWEKTIRAKLRSQIRRPTKEGMTFRAGVDELDSFYRVFARNMRDLGTPVLPREFFQRASEEFGSDLMFATVYSATGLPVAAGCAMLWKNEIEITWASSLREFNHLSPNMLLYFRLMEEAVSRGMQVFNFGRCTPGSTTHRFKSQWGGEDVPLPWPSWSAEPDVGVPSAESPLYKVAIAAWRTLPLAVTNRLGPRLARLLP
jgi:serine/alanine adding enzyme